MDREVVECARVLHGYREVLDYLNNKLDTMDEAWLDDEECDRLISMDRRLTLSDFTKAWHAKGHEDAAK
eukprot:6645556-Pyramimonas_sp.AAC.1